MARMGHLPSDDLRLAHRLADLAAETATRLVAAGFATRTKPDGTPVTEVDEAVEDALRELLSTERPADAVLGEERGATGRSARCWVIDAIDGTANLAAGSPLWGTLIALEDERGFALGLLSAPVFGRRWWAERGGGAWRTKAPDAWAQRNEAVRVSSGEDLAGSRATVLPDSAGVIDGAVVLSALSRVCEVVEPLGQPAILVAEGQIEASVHLGGGPWDHAALAIIVEEAGGRWSDIDGGRRIDTGAVVFSNGRVHESLLGALRPAR